MSSSSKCLQYYGDNFDNFGDISNIDYNKYNDGKIKGLNSVCKRFFDSFLIWYYGPLKYYISVRNYVTDVLSELGLNNVYVECVSNGLANSNDFITKNTAYISCNVTSYREKASNVLQALLDNNVLKNYSIIVRYMDFTADHLGCKNRQDLLNFLLRKGYITLNDVVDDINKVGRNCISFNITINGIEVIVRIYNKFAEILESPGVRKIIGSSLSTLIYNKCKRFRKSLKKCKKYGMMRVEIRVPGPRVYNLDTYQNLMDHVKGMFENFAFDKTSFENQYKALVDEVSDKYVAMLYFEKDKIFSVGQWCNSLTGKIQGFIKENVEEKYVGTLRANYSFDGRITKFIKVDKDGNIVVTYYKRTTKNITSTSGLRNSLYPCTYDLQSYYKSFEKMGLTNYKGMHFGWPHYIDKRSRPLADMKVINITQDKDVLQTIYKPNKQDYKAIYKALQPFTKYKVIALCKDTYRGKQTFFAKVKKHKNILYIRCGDSLRMLLEGEEMHDCFRIKTGNVVYKNRNMYDLECSLV